MAHPISERRCAMCGQPREYACAWCKVCHAYVVFERKSRERLPVGRRSADTVELVVLLDIGFVFITETPEELARLRKPERPVNRGSSVARSKIGTTELAVITPIDRTAAKVVPVNA